MAKSSSISANFVGASFAASASGLAWFVPVVAVGAEAGVACVVGTFSSSSPNVMV